MRLSSFEMKFPVIAVVVLCTVGLSTRTQAQGIPDTARRIELAPRTMVMTPLPVALREDAPLDHDWSRGLTIVSQDRQLQLQVQASVRNLAVLDGHSLPTPSSFSTADIPTGDQSGFNPRFYDDLRQTRLALIGSRESEIGRITVRVEADFNGPDGIRLRHAYGEFENVIVGQTWSLFSHVRLLPYTVDANGPLGANRNLVPQVRFRMADIWPSGDLTIGAEFGDHTYRSSDSAAIASHQLLPDPVVRARHAFDWGTMEGSFILPMLAGRYGVSGDVQVRVGWGFSASCEVPVTSQATMYLNTAFGQGIADAFPTLAGAGRTLHVQPGTDQAELAFTASGFVAGEYRWDDLTRSTISLSALTHDGRAYESVGNYRWGWQFTANTFWTLFSGMHVGVEWVVGGRADLDASTGLATRLSSLLWYEL